MNHELVKIPDAVVKAIRTEAHEFERKRILREMAPQLKEIRKRGYSLTAKQIEKVVRGEMDE